MSKYTRGLMAQFCEQIDAEVAAEQRQLDDIVTSGRLSGIVFSCAAVGMNGVPIGVVCGGWMTFVIQYNIDPSTFDGVGR